MNVSFSGILNSIMKLWKLPENERPDINDVCYSLQETAYSMLVEIVERALSFTDSKEVLIVGGVGCNLRLQNMMSLMAKYHNVKLYATDERYTH